MLVLFIVFDSRKFLIHNLVVFLKSIEFFSIIKVFLMGYLGKRDILKETIIIVITVASSLRH